MGRRMPKFLLIGHRGNGMNQLQSSDRRMRAIKENSILSFNAAANFPIDFIEFDVQVSRPNLWILNNFLIFNFWFNLIILGNWMHVSVFLYDRRVRTAFIIIFRFFGKSEIPINFKLFSLLCFGVFQ